MFVTFDFYLFLRIFKILKELLSYISTTSVVGACFFIGKSGSIIEESFDNLLLLFFIWSAVFHILLFIPSHITEVDFSYQFFQVLTHQSMSLTATGFKYNSGETPNLKNYIIVVTYPLLRIIKKMELSE